MLLNEEIQPLTDIENRKDIELLINKFYKRVIADDLIGMFFTKIVQLDWEIHIPIMYDFWESTLLGAMKYKGNPMIKHIQLSEKEPLNHEHFEQWLSLWENTINDNFIGENAQKAIKKARQIGELMQYKIKHHGEWNE